MRGGLRLVALSICRSRRGEIFFSRTEHARTAIDAVEAERTSPPYFTVADGLTVLQQRLDPKLRRTLRLIKWDRSFNYDNCNCQFLKL